jgi:putative FmdB family regulatory protein
MPIYEYRCLECDNEFERMQKFSDSPLTECPSCGGRVQKLISRSAFHLKGDGWYVTDYARKSGSNGTTNSSDSTDKQDQAQDNSTASKTESKSESKSESKTESKTESSSSSSKTATAST